MTPARERPFTPPPGARMTLSYCVGLARGDDGGPSGEVVLVLDPRGDAPVYLKGEPHDFETLAARLMRLAHQARGGGGLQ